METAEGVIKRLKAYYEVKEEGRGKWAEDDYWADNGHSRMDGMGEMAILCVCTHSTT